MYVGDVDDGSGLHHMVWEVLANSIDELLAGHCTTIDVTILPDGAVAIEDDGRGIRVDDTDGVPFAERALTTFHDTPTMDGHAPHEHLGLRGVGLFAVCALSRYVLLEAYREGAYFKQRFERGVAVSALERLGATNRSGTRLTFLPDSEVFRSTWIDPGLVAAKLRELSFLLPGLKLSLRDAIGYPSSRQLPP